MQQRAGVDFSSFCMRPDLSWGSKFSLVATLFPRGINSIGCMGVRNKTGCFEILVLPLYIIIIRFIQCKKFDCHFCSLKIKYSLFVFKTHMVIWTLWGYWCFEEHQTAHRALQVRDSISELLNHLFDGLKLAVCSLKDQVFFDPWPSPSCYCVDTQFRKMMSHTEKLTSA